MIEIITNLIQMLFSGICAWVALRRAVRAKSREWSLLALFFASFAFADLYWLLYLLFFRMTPKYFFLSDLIWYVSFLFLLLLLQYIKGDRREMYRSRLSWIGPVIAAGMCVFYMRWGDYLSNIISACLMGILLWRAIGGLVYLHNRPKEETRARYFLIITLIFCLLEYALWTVSCFWMGDTMANPYFWFDLLITGCMLLFLPALGKAVAD